MFDVIVNHSRRFDNRFQKLKNKLGKAIGHLKEILILMELEGNTI